MQPFTSKSAYTVLLGVAGYALCYFLFSKYTGIEWILARSVTFVIIFGAGVYFLKLTPDLFHVITSMKKRARKII